MIKSKAITSKSTVGACPRGIRMLKTSFILLTSGTGKEYGTDATVSRNDILRMPLVASSAITRS